MNNKNTLETFEELQSENIRLDARYKALVAELDRPFTTRAEFVGVAYVLCRCLEPSDELPLPNEARTILYRMAEQLQSSMVQLGFLDDEKASIPAHAADYLGEG
jgi:glutamine synthetase